MEPSALIGLVVKRKDNKAFLSGDHSSTVLGIKKHSVSGLDVFFFKEHRGTVPCHLCILVTPT